MNLFSTTFHNENNKRWEKTYINLDKVNQITAILAGEARVTFDNGATIVVSDIEIHYVGDRLSVRNRVKK